jgi:hypothetical protein
MQESALWSAHEGNADRPKVEIGPYIGAGSQKKHQAERTAQILSRVIEQADGDAH